MLLALWLPVLFGRRHWPEIGRVWGQGLIPSAPFPWVATNQLHLFIEAHHAFEAALSNPCSYSLWVSKTTHSLSIQVHICLLWLLKQSLTTSWMKWWKLILPVLEVEVPNPSVVRIGCLLGGSEGESVSCFFLASGPCNSLWYSCFVAALLLVCLQDSVAISLTSLGLCLNAFFSEGRQPHWVRLDSKRVWSHLNLTVSTKTLFPNQFTFWDSRRTWILGRNQPVQNLRVVVICVPHHPTVTNSPLY